MAIEVTLLHELTHWFVGKIHGRDAKTPIRFLPPPTLWATPPPWAPQANSQRGESGWWLEAQFFQGTFHFIRKRFSASESWLLTGAVVVGVKGKKIFDENAIDAFQDGERAEFNELMDFDGADED